MSVHFSAVSAWLVTIAITCGVVMACSEATDGLVPPDELFDAGGTSGSNGTSGTSGTSGAPVNPGRTLTTGAVLINEVSKEDWVELINTGATSVDLGGWMIADLDKDSLEPKLDDAVTFPAGTMLAANAYGMVRGGGLDAGIECPPGSQSFCLNAKFGISKNGETIFFIAPDGGVAGSVTFPAEAAEDLHTWARLPNGDPNGEFKVAEETPGAPNIEP